MTKFSMLKLSLFAAVLALPSASTLNAQVMDGQAKIQVPFAFQVGTEHFAPGTYTIGMLNGFTLNVRGGGNAALASMKTDGNGKAIASSKVVFVRVGGQYFLHEVWAAGSADHLVALQTKAEKQAQKLEAANRANAPAVEIALAK